MKNEIAYIHLAHNFVRAMLLCQPVDSAYLRIFKSIFPGAIRGEFARSSHRVDRSYLQGICDCIYLTDMHETDRASCYSACIVVQAFAFLHGIRSDMVLGVRKQDEKLIGHAWLELHTDSPSPDIVNPGEIGLHEYRVLTRMNPEAAITQWANSL